MQVDVTMSLMRAMWIYKTGSAGETVAMPRFDRLVYYERCNNIREAYARKTELSAQPRRFLSRLVERRNPTWEDYSRPWFPVTSQDRLMPCYAAVEAKPRRHVVH